MTSFDWFASLAPAGHAMCALCFEAVPVHHLHLDDAGQRWDVCQACQWFDAAGVAQRDGDILRAERLAFAAAAAQQILTTEREWLP